MSGNFFSLLSTLEMDKWLALFALIVLHLSRARSAPERGIPGTTMATVMECQQMINPTPEEILHCRRVIQMLDNEFHKCCLQRRTLNREDNCMTCARSSSQGAAVESEEDIIRKSWDIPCKLQSHTKACITQRRVWGRK